jgi:hypothetical protein
VPAACVCRSCVTRHRALQRGMIGHHGERQREVRYFMIGPGLARLSLARPGPARLCLTRVVLARL